MATFKKLAGFDAGYMHGSHHVFRYERGERESIIIGVRRVSPYGKGDEVQFDVSRIVRGDKRTMTHDASFVVPGDAIEEFVAAIVTPFKREDAD